MSLNDEDAGDELVTPNAEAWTAALHAAFAGSPPASACWTDLHDIWFFLGAVCQPSLSQTFFPDCGGYSFESVQKSREPQCIELVRAAGRYHFLCKVEKLEFRHFEERPSQSFFLLHTLPLELTEVHSIAISDTEVVVRLGSGRYVEAGSYEAVKEEGEDLDGSPDGIEIHRKLCGGKFLTVAKSSHWHRSPWSGRGPHRQMSADEIVSGIVEAHRSGCL